MQIPDTALTSGNLDWAETIREALGPRRFRLLLSGCCRGLFVEPLAKEVADAFERGDRFGDTGKTKAALSEARKLLRYAPRQASDASFFRFADPFNVLREILAPELEARLLSLMGLCAQYHLQQKVPVATDQLRWRLTEVSPLDFEMQQFDSRWRTSDVLGLARAIYKERDFERMPILADALMDAGCEDAAIIGHCRGENGHMRGCWVLDLIRDGQWETAWIEPKTVRKGKADKPLFKLDSVDKREFERWLANEAKLDLEDAVTAEYDKRQREREEARKQQNHSQRLEYLFSSLTLRPNTWVYPGIVRRVTFDDPRELARSVRISARLHWILEGRGQHEPWPNCYALLEALAIRDDLAVRRLLETSPFPLPHNHDAYYNAIFAAARGELDFVRTILPQLRSDALDRYLRPSALCLVAIAEGSAASFASNLGETIREHRRNWGSNRVLKLIDLHAHGLHELAKRVSPALVADFDVNHPLPWDAAFHRWMASSDEASRDLDWEKVPIEIRDGLRELPRPTWWDSPPDEPDPQGMEDIQSVLQNLIGRFGSR